jgi:hypothetical protein
MIGRRAQVDAEAKKRSTSRSAPLTAANRRELERDDSEAVAAAVTRSWERFHHAGRFESTDLTRVDRDTRW